MIFEQWRERRQNKKKWNQLVKQLVNDTNCMVCDKPLDKKNIEIELGEYGEIVFIRHTQCKRSEYGKTISLNNKAKR